MRNTKAIIFDMDGVLSDTQKFHAQVESMILKNFGINITPTTITKKYAGVEDKKMFSEIFEKHGIAIPALEDIVEKKWDLMGKIAKGKITEIPGASKLIQVLHNNGLKLAIASASTKKFIAEVVNTLQLSGYFDAIVSTQEVKKGKPSPDIFLLAAHRLGIYPEDAIVIEDGRSGMIGAKAANMKCIGFVEDIKANYPATVLVNSLKDIDLEMIHSL